MATAAGDATFRQEVLNASATQPVIVEAWASWCAPCKSLGPILEKVVAEASGAAKLVQIDVDAAPQFSEEFGIQSIPAVFGVVGGRVVSSFVGAQSEQVVRQFVTELVRSGAGPTTSPDRGANADRPIDEGDRADVAVAVASRHVDLIAGARAKLLRDWQRHSAAVDAARRRELELSQRLHTHMAKLDEFVKSFAELGYRRSELAGASSSTVPAADAFERALQDARNELVVARSKTFKGGPWKRARASLDDYQDLLNQLNAALLRARDDIAAATKARDVGAQTARAELEPELIAGRTVLDDVLRGLPATMLPFHASEWGSWQPRNGSPVVFGGTLRPHPDPQLGPNHSFGCQEAVPFYLPSRESLELRHSGIDRARTQDFGRALMLRTIASLPPGRAQFTIFDPVGLGQSVADLLELAEFDQGLLGGKVWSSTQDLRARLHELTAQVELVIQKYLRAEYRTIDEFNAEAGEIAEPFRFLVLFDFPKGLDQSALLELTRVVENGPRCGVYTLLVRNTELPADYGVDLGTLPQIRSIAVAAPFGAVHVGYRLDLSLTPDSLDSLNDEFVERVVDSLGRAAQERSASIVGFDTSLRLFYENAQRGVRPDIPRLDKYIDADDPRTWWTCNSTRELVAPLGQRGARDSAVLRLDSVDNAGALLIGRPGSGKSTLLHTYITGLVTLYPPQELELYLVDFKQGVEFKGYAEHGLPHARCVAVETDREFGLSVLESIDAEIQRRAAILRSTGGRHSGLATLRAASEAPLPRILLVFDEFQALFVQNDRIGLKAADLLESIIRQGRGFGVHVLLASQSLSGLEALGAHVPQLLPVRILLPATEADARRVLGEGNDAGSYLTQHGEGILNDANGSVEANQRVRVAFLDEAERPRRLEQVAELAVERGWSRRPVVFEGASAVPFDQVDPRTWREELAKGRGLALRQAAPMTLGGVVDVTLRRESGANVLVVCRPIAGDAPGPDGHVTAVPLSLATTAALAASGSGARVRILDFTSVDDGFEELVEPILASDKRVTIHRRRQLVAALQEVRDEVSERTELDDRRSPPELLMIVGLHRARDFDPDEPGDADAPHPASILEGILRNGPDVGVHVWLWSETVSSLDRRLSYGSLRECGWRIAGQMSADNSQRLLGSESAGGLRGQQVILANEDLGVERRCLAYRHPTREWVRAFYEDENVKG